uniref:Uncharacterized protein n=1 Tax=Oryzias melastigma TaxID=30732 RepID=A0A3B3DJV1_ORYME
MSCDCSLNLVGRKSSLVGWDSSFVSCDSSLEGRNSSFMGRDSSFVTCDCSLVGSYLILMGHNLNLVGRKSSLVGLDSSFEHRRDPRGLSHNLWDLNYESQTAIFLLFPKQNNEILTFIILMYSLYVLF